MPNLNVLAPQLRPFDENIRQVPTGLQTDNNSCGFWSVLFAWGTLLGFDAHQIELAEVAVQDLKQMYELLWRAFLSDPDGLRTSLVREVFEPFQPDIEWDDMPEIVRGTST